MRSPRINVLGNPIQSMHFHQSRHRIGFYIKDEQMSQLSKRKTSFGYGRKSDFTKDLTASPRATLYSHKSVFEEQTSKKNGKSFGLSREKSPDRSYLIPQLHKNPGPGKVNFSFIIV